MKELRAVDREMIALDIDEPLWNLSKYGCTKRDEETGNCIKKRGCVVGKFCVKGQIKMEDNDIVLNT